MPFDRRLMQDLRRLDRHDLRRALIFVRGLLQAERDDAGDPTADPDDAGVTYRLESVRCGKPNCASCPHGPYWYAYYREKGKLRSRYIGPDRGGDGPDRPDRGDRTARSGEMPAKSD